MSDLADLSKLPDDFDGRVRLFPLPDLVFFPHVMQPLHIFEPRYCDLLAEARSTDDLIAMATLSEGWETNYEGRPKLESIVCVAKVVSHAETDDDRHNILVLGVQRARILTELESDCAFRRAWVEVLEDTYTPAMADQRTQVKRRLVEQFQKVLPVPHGADKGFSQMLASHLPLGPLTDVIGFTLPMCNQAKLALLGEPNADRRAEQLLKLMVAMEADEAELGENADAAPVNSPLFPPAFSDN